MKNSAERKKLLVLRNCRICGIYLKSEKERRRGKCKKCHRVAQRGWRSPKTEIRRIHK